MERKPFSILGERLGADISLVKEEEEYNWYGVYSAARIIDEASARLHGNTDISLENARDLLTDFISRTTADHIQDKTERWGDAFDQTRLACWISVRMTKPTDEFTDKPRWHRDGRMFECENEKDAHNKYAMTILNRPTLALEETEVTRTLAARGHDLSDEELIEGLANEPRVVIQPTDIIKFSWGQDDSPVHSEPDMSNDRVFISILFGSVNEMRTMCEWREEPYRE
jgi:hypothetical protein